MSPTRRALAIVAGPVLALLVATTVAAGPAEAPKHARGDFVNAAGTKIGTIHLSQDRHGVVHANVKVKGLTPGLHGIHIHSVASCTPGAAAPFFLAAGGHYDPVVPHQHGLENPAGPHAGDLPNLVVNAHGHGRLNARTDRVTLTDGPATLFDANGSAFIIHANQDDQVSDVANGGAANGGSGARIACAVIVADR